MSNWVSAPSSEIEPRKRSARHTFWLQTSEFPLPKPPRERNETLNPRYLRSGVGNAQDSCAIKFDKESPFRRLKNGRHTVLLYEKKGYVKRPTTYPIKEQRRQKVDRETGREGKKDPPQGEEYLHTLPNLPDIAVSDRSPILYPIRRRGVSSTLTTRRLSIRHLSLYVYVHFSLGAVKSVIPFEYSPALFPPSRSLLFPLFPSPSSFFHPLQPPIP